MHLHVIGRHAVRSHEPHQVSYTAANHLVKLALLLLVADLVRALC